MERLFDTQRFELVRRLGAGATGVVYEAENRQTGEQVALKALTRLDAASLYRFKREFRALSGVAHPNLVSLHELFYEGGNWYLAMELVRGASFVDHVRRGDALDLARLRPALAQLVRALAALHHAGRLHCDIKPSNVLVTHEGRVVVLDFGFVHELDHGAPVESSEVLGTPAYMAPEQCDAGGAVAASDWYAVGVVLFEALTGRLPFLGSSSEVLLAKLQREAPRAGSLCGDVPADLDALCAALLARTPALRPDAGALLAEVGALTEEPSAPPPPEVFVGRDDALGALRRALKSARARGRPRVVTLVGASAIGKSTLLKRFAAELGGQGAWVLSSRCHERENVPFKALDGIVDALAQRLSELSDVELALLLPRYLGALTLQFPVLLRVPAVARQAARYVRPADPHELRRHGAAAFEELLARIADHHALVLLIDDHQWGDVDSVHLLRDALSVEDVPGILFVSAQRVGERASSPALAAFDQAFQELGRRGQTETLSLAPLAEADAAALAEQLLAGQGNRALAVHVARESGGVPLFIQELVRHVLRGGSPTATLEQLVQQRLGRLSSAARELLELIAVASAPLSMAIARALSPRADVDAVLRELLREGLVLRSLASLETRHSQIRVIIERLLPAARASQHHLTLARTLAAHGAEPEELAHHFMSAGDPERAAGYAVRAGDAALAALAFESAARCYELALAWGRVSPHEQCALRVRQAEALASAGRGREAGEAYVRAAEQADPGARLGLMARAVDQLFRAGHLEDGLALGDRLLAELGLGRAATGGRALIDLLLRRARMLVRGYGFVPREHVPAEALVRVEAARAMSLGLGHMDPFAAASMQARHLTLALDSGDRVAAARALGYEAVYLGIEGAGSTERALTLLSRQRDVQLKSGHPYLRALAHYARGVIDWGRGAWLSALEELDAAEAIYRNDLVGATWEVLATQLLAFGCLSFMGRFDELRRRVLPIAEQARVRDDRLTLQWILTWQSVVDVTRDALPQAEEALADARTRLAERHYTLPHVFALYAASCVNLYVADGQSAYERLAREWPLLRRSQVLRIQVYRVEMLRLRIAAALCAAARAASKQRRLLHEAAARDLASVEAEQVPWATALAQALRGELQLQQGRADQAERSWSRSIELLTAVDMGSAAAVARRWLGMLVAGDEGAALVRKGDEWLARHGFADPERVGWLHGGGYHHLFAGSPGREGAYGGGELG